MRSRASALYEALDEAAELFLQAVGEAEGDREILAVAHEGVATCCFWRFTRGSTRRSSTPRLASALALELGDEALAADALGTRSRRRSVARAGHRR